jgi:hypothetical protein
VGKEERGEVEKINAKIMKIPTFYLSSYHSFKLTSRLVGGGRWRRSGRQGENVRGLFGVCKICRKD